MYTSPSGTTSNAGRSLLLQSLSGLLSSHGLTFVDSFAISSEAGDLDSGRQPIMLYDYLISDYLI